MDWVGTLLQAGRRGVPGIEVSLLVLVILIVDILILVSVWKSRKTFLVKVVWTLVVVFTSFVGWILYFFLGREKK